MTRGVIHNMTVFLLTHGLLMLITAVMSFFLLSPLLAILPALVSLYVVLGCRYLMPLPKNNFVPFIPLTILLFGVALAAAQSGQEMFSLMVNVPSILLLVLLENFIRPPEPYSPISPDVIIGAAFIPSLLMYAGLRLKIWRESKRGIEEGERP